jgi:hypothetical protein
MKSKYNFITLTLFFVISTGQLVAQSSAEFNTDVLSYQINIELNDSSNIIRVEQQIRAVLQEDAKEISFDLYSVDEQGKGMEVHSLQIAGLRWSICTKIISSFFQEEIRK